MEKNKKLRDEILRYLGYKDQKIDDFTNQAIEDSINELEFLADKRYTYKKFPIRTGKGTITAEGVGLPLVGRDIQRHLNKSDNLILMAATLGHEVDTRIRYYGKTDMSRALILDATSTAFIEDFCNEVCIDIEKELGKDKFLTRRFSPGYGDLPIEIQKDFLESLGSPRTIGLTTNSNNILIPRKSVTAVLGVVRWTDRKKTGNKAGTCLHCSKYNECNFTRREEDYGY